MPSGATRDAYDEAVDYLQANPGDIYEAWGQPERHPAGILFGYVTEDRFDPRIICACLTQIRQGGEYVYRGAQRDKALTSLIREDVRMPSNPRGINDDNLPFFAEWNRRIDRELGRDPPAWTGPKTEATP